MGTPGAVAAVVPGGSFTKDFRLRSCFHVQVRAPVEQIHRKRVKLMGKEGRKPCRSDPVLAWAWGRTEGRASTEHRHCCLGPGCPAPRLVCGMRSGVFFCLPSCHKHPPPQQLEAGPSRERGRRRERQGGVSGCAVGSPVPPHRQGGPSPEACPSAPPPCQPRQPWTRPTGLLQQELGGCQCSPALPGTQQPFPAGVPQWEPRPRLGRTQSLTGFLVAQTASIFWQRKAGRRGSLISTGML